MTDIYIADANILFDLFDIDDLEEIQSLYQVYRGLSFEDCSILLMRKKQEAVILTGDGLLRRTAAGLGYEVHGIIWVLDRLIEKGKLTCCIARNKLMELMAINQRLPKTLCGNRLEAWEKMTINKFFISNIL